MKKVLVTLNLLLALLLVTGCGCSKKQKILDCTSELDEYGEKKHVEAKFEDNYLKTQVIETITVFDEELYANRFYEMYKDSDTYEVSINGLEVTLKQTIETTSTEDIFKYDNFYNSMLENGFKCENK